MFTTKCLLSYLLRVFLVLVWLLLRFLLILCVLLPSSVNRLLERERERRETEERGGREREREGERERAPLSNLKKREPALVSSLTFPYLFLCLIKVSFTNGSASGGNCF